MENVTTAAATEDVKEKRSADVGPLSIDVEPDLKSNWYLDRSLQEHYVLKQAVNLWHGPKYPSYCALAERIRSFENSKWPETNPSPVSLAEAGFCYDGECELTPFLNVSINLYYIHRKGFYNNFCL
jgi:hypothetical protein